MIQTVSSEKQKRKVLLLAELPTCSRQRMLEPQLLHIVYVEKELTLLSNNRRSTLWKSKNGRAKRQ